jgi:hypothetical protein
MFRLRCSDHPLYDEEGNEKEWKMNETRKGEGANKIKWKIKRNKKRRGIK